MTEVLTNLPAELKNKVFTYQRHPVAELFKTHALPGLLALDKMRDEMAEFFPDLTRGELMWTESKDDVPHMFRLHFLLFEFPYKETCRHVYYQWKEVLPVQEFPVVFVKMLDQFLMTQKMRWKKMPPEEFLEWVKEHCVFSVTD